MTGARPPQDASPPASPQQPAQDHGSRASSAAAPPPTPHQRRPGDGWVDCRCGHRHWGLNGAAGLLLWRHRAPGSARAAEAPGVLEVLLQLRAPWTHHGDTWGLPGGAVATGESPTQAALRELEEETGLPAHQLALGGSQIQQHPDWSYTTFAAQAPHGGTWDRPTPLDRESTTLAWTPLTGTQLTGTQLATQPGGAAATLTWAPPCPPAPGGTQAPLLPALRQVWTELAALLPPPGRQARGAAGATGPQRSGS